MKLKSPVTATVLGGLLLGVTLRLAMPTTPLPPPEPTWRKSGAAMAGAAISGAAGAAPYYSAQTYETQANAYGYNYASDRPQPTAAGFVPHPPEETLAYAQAVVQTSYVDLPRYDVPTPQPREAASGEAAVSEAQSATTELVVLPEPADTATLPSPEDLSSR